MRHVSLQYAIHLFALALAILASPVRAGDGCCAHCGCDCCQKVCRLVCEEKKVEIVCWGCKCEDFCLGGPSKRGCKHCDIVCDDCDEQCDPKAPYSQAKKFVWSEWIPSCKSHLYTKKKLMKKVETKKVPSFKWVVEELCDECASQCEVANIPAGADVPLPPIVEATFIYGRPVVTVSSSEGK